MTSLHVSFLYKGMTRHYDLVQSQNPKDSIKINGSNYSAVAADKDSAIALDILKVIFPDAMPHETNLDGRLRNIQGVENIRISTVQKVGEQILSPQSNHTWQDAEISNLPKMVKFVARTFWDNKERMDLSGLKKFLGKDNFDQALQSPTPEAFLVLFEGLSVDDLWDIRTSERCHPLGFVKTVGYIITPQNLLDLKAYLDDIGFSGVVCLSDSAGTYSVTPTGQEALENASFSMQSITKVFTGVLALATLPAPEDNQLDLAPSTLSALTKPVKARLTASTTLQSMTHNAGFGDYLSNYEKAILIAIENGTELPVIEKAEDFLAYADTTLYPMDQNRYSNLGILLVGLAIQHKLGDRSFDDILHELILSPAQIQMSATKPSNGRFSSTDPSQGNVKGSPGGGYWIKCGDLLKFGNWLQKKCNEPEFAVLVEKYGNEFYVKEDREIRHNGCSSSGSSLLSSFKECGVTIAVLSDQGNFMADRIYYTIRERLIEKT